MKSSFSSCPQHESFEELAALAAIGELSPLELQRLRHHLSECVSCREVYEAFAEVASNDLGVAAAATHPTEDVGHGNANGAEAREHLRRLRNRLEGDASAKQLLVDVRRSESGKNHRAGSWRRAAYGIAATILLAVARIAFLRTTKDVSPDAPRSRGLQPVSPPSKQQTNNTTPRPHTPGPRPLP